MQEVALSAGQQLAVATSGEVGAVRKVDSQRIFDSFDPESFAAFLESAEAVSVTRSAQDEILIRSHE